MHDFDYYRLEKSVEKNSKRFSALEIVSLSLKIAAIVSLLLLFKYFYIAIALWCLSFVPNYFKNRLVYKYVYVVKEGRLEVIREYDYNKTVICESVDIINADIKRGECEKRYYDASCEIPLIIKGDKEAFGIDVDEYMYALIEACKGGKNDIFG